ncbi:MAG: hypothetical protein ISS31_01085 [Kiritimatiellae bacterium]|nr:hypothetical protein [Kiritimatiellia bacterium]
MSQRTRSTCWPFVWSVGSNPSRILFSKACFSYLSWWRRPSFLRGGGSKKDTLFAGPWVGEFGWELMDWQGYLRALRGRYKRIIVSARPSSKALYDDFCDEFVPHGIRGESNAHTIFGIENPHELARVLNAIPANCDHLPPLRYIPQDEQSFIRFGGDHSDETAPDILVHARGRASVPGRNWPVEQWQHLAALLQEEGMTVGCIGLRNATLEVEGVVDYRDLPLAETMQLMSSCKCVVGPSSGAMHLASLCGSPHVVWTDRKSYGMGKTSREKYESWWNPLQTPVAVMDESGFSPDVADVRACIRGLLR